MGSGGSSLVSFVLFCHLLELSHVDLTVLISEALHYGRRVDKVDVGGRSEERVIDGLSFAADLVALLF